MEQQAREMAKCRDVLSQKREQMSKAKEYQKQAGQAAERGIDSVWAQDCATNPLRLPIDNAVWLHYGYSHLSNPLPSQFSSRVVQTPAVVATVSLAVWKGNVPPAGDAKAALFRAPRPIQTNAKVSKHFSNKAVLTCTYRPCYPHEFLH